MRVALSLSFRLKAFAHRCYVVTYASEEVCLAVEVGRETIANEEANQR